jgi:Ser/Thr protein kinase RdoA (MazF antagonist)
LYSSVERSDEYISRLLDFVRRAYGIEAIGISPAKRGFYGETWRLDATDASYFLKLVYPAVHKPVYERSFPLMQHLCDNGIDFISKIAKTAEGRLSSLFDGAVVGVFGWIDGENIENEKTKSAEYNMLARVYAVPSSGISIPREDFSGSSADMFFDRWKTIQDRGFRLLFEKNRAKIEHRAARLKRFSALCRGDASDFFITHGDAGGNVIESGDRHFIVDWDNAMLAPPERDAWFCMSRDWAMAAFNVALREKRISYALRPERLAYYCYDFFFFYLNAYVDASTHVDIVEEYIDGWIEESFKYADEHF